MGFLETGKPILWENLNETIKAKVRHDGLIQLKHIYVLNKSRQDTNLMWGDEMEFNMIHMSGDKKVSTLVVDAPKILDELNRREHDNEWDSALKSDKMIVLGKSKKTFLRGAEWHPEFGNHMIEATPSPPYVLSVEGLLDVEENMTTRRLKLQSILPANVYAVSLAAYPLLGINDFVYNPTHSLDTSPLDHSIGIPKCLPNPHPRFPTLVHNVNARRQAKICALVDVFQDAHTEDSPIWANSIQHADRKEVEQLSFRNHHPIKSKIYADNFAYGMSLCCLQTTFGSPNLEIARHLYDQFAVLAPLFLSLSAATPVLFGLLSAKDTRWPVLEQTCDCRTEEELKVLNTTRFGISPLYIGTSEYFRRNEESFNDSKVHINHDAYEILSTFMDPLLARHFAALWVRDPLVIFEDKVDLNNLTHADHFENIQSTNWNSVRFKPPPPSPDGISLPNIGWRVELRTPDIQLSDFENAAIASLSALLCMAIIKKGWHFYIPMTKNIENLQTANSVASCVRKLFWFPTNFESPQTNEKVKVERMTLRSIFLSSSRNGFPGLLPMLDKFVSEEWRGCRCSSYAVEKYRIYSSFLRSRVLGQSPSNAMMIRNIVTSHNDYQCDSVINNSIAFDICRFAILRGFNLIEAYNNKRKTVKVPWKGSNSRVFKELMKLKPRLDYINNDDTSETSDIEADSSCEQSTSFDRLLMLDAN